MADPNPGDQGRSHFKDRARLMPWTRCN